MEKDLLLEKMYHNNNELNLDHLGCMMFELAFSDRNTVNNDKENFSNNEKIIKSLRRALFFVKMFTQSSDVILYKMDKYNNYNFFVNGSVSLTNKNRLDILLRQQKERIENNAVTYYDHEYLENDDNAIVIPISVSGRKYALIIKNCCIENLHKNKKFIMKFTTYMSIILGQLIKSINDSKKMRQDSRTGLANSVAYKEAAELDKTSEPYTFVLFDLYRLKYLNDNYSYQLGDAYILNAAEILKKHFPMYHTYRDIDGSIKKRLTGSCIYRIGGDEFILIDKYDSLGEIEKRIMSIRKDVEEIKLNVREELHLGINYGLAYRGNGESLEELQLIAENNMHEDKKLMYEKFGDNRRR